MPFSQGATPVQGLAECGSTPTEGFPVTIQGCGPEAVPVPVSGTITVVPAACQPVEGCQADGTPTIENPVWAGMDVAGTFRGMRGQAGIGDNVDVNTQWLQVMTRPYIFDGTNLDQMRDANATRGTTGTGLLGAGIEGFDGTNWQAALVSAATRALVAQIDLARQVSPARYIVTLTLTGATAAGTNLGGLRKLLANPNVYLTRIMVMFHAFSGAAVPAPIAFYRASTVAGGTLVAAADITKKRTTAGNATLEARTGAVTGTKLAVPFYVAGGAAVGTAGTAGPQYAWEADELSDQLVLTGDEGIIIEQFAAGGSASRYDVTFEWEETTN